MLVLFSPKFSNQEPRDTPDSIILDVWVLPSFISVYILLTKVFLILVVFLVVRNNSCGNFSTSKFFLVNFNVVPILFFAADYSLFSCVFVSLTLASW